MPAHNRQQDGLATEQKSIATANNGVKTTRRQEMRRKRKQDKQSLPATYM